MPRIEAYDDGYDYSTLLPSTKVQIVAIKHCRVLQSPELIMIWRIHIYIDEMTAGRYVFCFKEMMRALLH